MVDIDDDEILFEEEIKEDKSHLKKQDLEDELKNHQSNMKSLIKKRLKEQKKFMAKINGRQHKEGDTRYDIPHSQYQDMID